MKCLEAEKPGGHEADTLSRLALRAKSFREATMYAATLTRKSLEMWRFASQNGSRAALTGVLLEPSGLLIATDSHLLAVFDTPESEDYSPPEDFPLAKGSPPSLPIPLGGLWIPGEVLKRASKALPKRTTLPALRSAAVWIGEGVAALQTTDLDTWDRAEWRLSDDIEFPNWRRVWPTEVGEMPQCYGGVAFSKLFSAIHGVEPGTEEPLACRCGKVDGVDLCGTGAGNAIVWHARRWFRGLVMPICPSDEDIDFSMPVREGEERRVAS